MVTKAIIESIQSPYEVTVRIPLFNSGSNFSQGSQVLNEAIVCVPPNCSFTPQIGDIVLVAFEDFDAGKPVIIGCLFKESGNSSTLNINASSLNVDGTTTLSEQSKIGDIGYSELKQLSGLGQNVQNSINNIEGEIQTLETNLNNTQSDLDTLESVVDAHAGNMDISKNLIVNNANPHLQLTLNNNTYYAQVYSENNLEGVGIGSTWAKSLIIDSDGHIRTADGANLTIPNQTGVLAIGGYSTGEVVIGKWIDNKTLYRKVINYNGNLNTNVEVEVGSIGTAIDSVVDIKQTSTYTPTGGNNSAYDLYYSPTTGNHTIIGCRVDLSNGKVYACSVNDSWADTHLIVIVEYTKGS